MRYHIRMGLYPFSLVLAGILLHVSGCVTSTLPEDNEHADTNYVSMDDTPTSHDTTRIISDILVFYTSFQELASRSTTIVIGSVIAPVEMINTARDIDDLSHPDPDYFSIGQIYEVEVERYLKGKGEKTIDIVQNQGFLIPQSDLPTTSEIEKARMEYDYIHLHPGQMYLFFVNDAQNQYGELENRNLFVGGWHPWLFNISDPECVHPLDTMIEIHAYFPPQPLTVIIKQINDPFDPSGQMQMFPYPPPMTTNKCFPGHQQGPYPSP